MYGLVVLNRTVLKTNRYTVEQDQKVMGMFRIGTLCSYITAGIAYVILGQATGQLGRSWQCRRVTTELEVAILTTLSCCTYLKGRRRMVFLLTSAV